MACEACTAKFTLFKRKKQCMDCLHYFCAGCVIKRSDRVLSCDNCSMLSRRPLIKSQIMQMRTRHLRNYLEAKKVNIRGCVEKDDLVNLLILYVNETDKLKQRYQSTANSTEYSRYQSRYNNDRPVYFENSRVQNVPVFETSREQVYNSNIHQPNVQDEPRSSINDIQIQENMSHNSENESNLHVNETNSDEQSQNLTNESNNREEIETISEVINSSQNELLEEITSQDNLESVTIQQIESGEIIVEDIDDLEELERRSRIITNETVEIEEIIESDILVSPESEPVIIESEETSGNLENSEMTDIQDSTKNFTEIKTLPENVQLSDIQLSSELNQLTTKQLKKLLCVNCVDFKGCVERYELLDKVLRLWTEYQQSRKEAESCDLDPLCKICLDAPIECVMLECGHMACCIKCGKQLSECPICRQYIVRVVRIFRS